MTDELTPCEQCGTPSLVLWGLNGKLVCKSCWQAAKQLPTLRQLVQARSQR